MTFSEFLLGSSVWNGGCSSFERYDRRTLRTVGTFKRSFLGLSVFVSSFVVILFCFLFIVLPNCSLYVCFVSNSEWVSERCWYASRSRWQGIKTSFIPSTRSCWRIADCYHGTLGMLTMILCYCYNHRRFGSRRFSTAYCLASSSDRSADYVSLYVEWWPSYERKCQIRVFL